ncbi:hypothetical protein GCM10009670_25960 [Citricoccus alkalitolerans]
MPGEDSRDCPSKDFRRAGKPGWSESVPRSGREHGLLALGAGPARHPAGPTPSVGQALGARFAEPAHPPVGALTRDAQFPRDRGYGASVLENPCDEQSERSDRH